MNHWIKKSFFSLTAISMLSIPNVSMAATNHIQVFTNGVEQSFKDAPYFKNSKLMVPLKDIVVPLGVQLFTRTTAPDVLLLHKDNHTVELFVGANYALVDNNEVKLDTALEWVNGTVMVPARFLAETFGAKVQWDQKSSTVRIDRNTASAQELRLPLTDEVMTLDPALAIDQNSVTLLSQLDEGLIRLDEQGRPIPGSAAAWDISQDGKTYTFHLSPKAKWSDGSPLTAQDYAYSWKRVLNPKVPSQYAFLLFPIVGAQKYHMGQNDGSDLAIKAIDDHTLQVQLTEPVPYFTDLLANPVFFPVKQAVVEKQGDKYGTEANSILTDGPFKLTDWQHEQTLVLQKDPTYWDAGNVRLQKVTYEVVNDPATTLNLYEAGQLDRTDFLMGEQVSQFVNSSYLVNVPQPITGFLEFNNDNKVLQNANIRKALAYAIDTNKLASAMYQNNGTVGATALVPPGISDGHGKDFRQNDLVDHTDNAAHAKALLKQGLAEVGTSSFPKLTLLADDGTAFKQGAQFIVDQWRQNLGIDVEVVSVPFKLRLQRSQNRDFDMVMSVWAGDYNDPTTFLDLMHSQNEFNSGNFSDKDYDDLLDKAHQEPDATTRMALLHKAEDLLIHQDMAVAPLYFKGQSYLRKPYVKGWVDHAFGASYDLKGTYIEGK